MCRPHCCAIFPGRAGTCRVGGGNEEQALSFLSDVETRRGRLARHEATTADDDWTNEEVEGGFDVCGCEGTKEIDEGVLGAIPSDSY